MLQLVARSPRAIYIQLASYPVVDNLKSVEHSVSDMLQLVARSPRAIYIQLASYPVVDNLKDVEHSVSDMLQLVGLIHSSTEHQVVNRHSQRNDSDAEK